VTADQGVLFDVDPVLAPEPGEAVRLSYGRRLTLRQKADVVRGVHPLTRGKARPDLGTCGDCVHRYLIGYSGTYPKCELGPNTHSQTTDVRRWWPACDRFEPGDGISPDAARWTPTHSERP
jgi:hypothetical protein